MEEVEAVRDASRRDHRARSQDMRRPRAEQRRRNETAAPKLMQSSETRSFGMTRMSSTGTDVWRRVQNDRCGHAENAERPRRGAEDAANGRSLLVDDYAERSVDRVREQENFRPRDQQRQGGAHEREAV
jgi:hypothetical protein